MLRRFLPPSLLLVGCAAHVSKPPPAEDSPRAVVAIVIDQFASWQADERVPELAQGNGFGRLLRDGEWVHRMVFAHGASDTALGHAALFSGRAPGEIGVDRNETCAGGSHRSAFADPSARLVPLRGSIAPGRAGVSLEGFPESRGAFVSDALRTMAVFGDRGGVIGVSLKDRASLQLCGATPDFCAFFDRTSGGFVTSERFLGRPGSRELWGAVAADPEAPRPDPKSARPLPVGLRGAPADFDDAASIAPPLRSVDPSFLMFRARPEADEAIAALALTAATRWQATHPDAPLFVALSLSAHDYVGHSYGARSPASRAHLERIDVILGRVFSWLDAHYPDRWTVVLSSDHGVRSSDLPRLRPEDLFEQLRHLHPADWPDAPLDCLADPYLRWRPDVPRETRRRYVAHWRQHLPPLLGGIVDEDSECPGQGAEAAICRALVPGRSLAQDSYVFAAPEAILDPEGLEGQGSNHGSPHLEDRTVPLFVLDASRRRPRETSDEVGFERFRAELLAPFASEPPARAGER